MQMLDNIGGRNSEMSAVSLYYYNTIVLDKHEDIAEIFRKISIVEMHHLDIFGRLAYQMGANPRLWTRGQRGMLYWTPGYNHYPVPLKSLLNNALEGELSAIAKYERQAKEIQDANVVENLKRIILDEQLHVEVYRSLLAEHRGQPRE